jgi:hypothetical protein
MAARLRITGELVFRDAQGNELGREPLDGSVPLSQEMPQQQEDAGNVRVEEHKD